MGHGDYSHKLFHHNLKLFTTYCGPYAEAVLGGTTEWSDTSVNRELAECNNVDVA